MNCVVEITNAWKKRTFDRLKSEEFVRTPTIQPKQSGHWPPRVLGGGAFGPAGKDAFQHHNGIVE